jgi:hypothetical protein
VAARSTTWVSGRTLVGTAGSNSAGGGGGHGCLSLLGGVCGQVEDVAKGRSLVLGRATECVCH